MAKYTHDAIMTTFTEMIGEMPFDKITVSELVRRCNISPNTFYYHYKDIYALLDDWFREGLNRFMSKDIDRSNWKSLVKEILRMCKKHEIATYHIYNSLSRDSFERFAFRQSEDLIKLGIAQIATNYNVKIPDDKLDLVSNACKFMFLGLFMQFIWNKMTDDIDQYVDSYGGIIEDLLSVELAKYSLLN